MPPTSGPSATAPKMQTLRIIAVQRSFESGNATTSGGHGRDQQQARAQALQDVADDEEARVGRRRREHRAEYQQRGVDDQHPTLGQELSQQHGQDRAHGIAGVGQPEVRLIACRLMCRSLAMIGVIGWSAADSVRYGTRAKMTIAATAG